MSRSAFIGCSIDSKLFTKEWFCETFEILLKKYDSILVLLADDLMLYTRSFSTYANILNYNDANERIKKRCESMAANILSVKKEFDMERIIVASWQDYTDSLYMHIYRKLVIAYTTIDCFKNDVDSLAQEHAIQNQSLKKHRFEELSILYILDEMAMCLRITEFTDFIHEYYPVPQLKVLEYLYNDKYKDYGLSIGNLLNTTRKRTFLVI